MKTASSPLLAESLYEDQIKLERKAVEEGVARYQRLAAQAAARGEASSLKPVEKLIATWFTSLRDTIRESKRQLRQGLPVMNAGRWGPVVVKLTSDKLATIALNQCLECLVSPLVRSDESGKDGNKLGIVSHIVGQAVLTEVAYQVVTKEHRNAKPDDDTLLDKLRHSCGKESVADVRWFIRKEVPDAIFEKALGVYIGDFLLYQIAGSCFIGGEPAIVIEMKKQTKHGEWVDMNSTQSCHAKTWRWIRLSERARNAIKDANDTRALLRPSYLPMIVQPMPWQQDPVEKGGKIHSGGYITIHTPLVTQPTRSHKKWMRQVDIRGFLEKFNTVGATSLAPSPMIDVVVEAWKSGSEQLLAKLNMPPKHYVPMPDKAPDDATLEEIKEAKARRARAYDKNIEIQSHRRLVDTTLNVVESMREYENIWLPHQADFRSRSYPIPTHMSFQASQWQRVCLWFARKKEPNARGKYWLMVNCANYYGVDKVSYDDRVEWVLANLNRIENAARRGLDDDWWMEAKQPLPFLAACRSIVNEEYASHLSVDFDGSANGLQWFAALGRDSVAAESVNMTWRASPADPYKDVEKEAVSIIRRDGLPIGEQAIALTNRDFSKSLLMPMGYGQTAWGARETVRKHLLENGHADPTDKSGRRLKEESVRLYHYLSDVMSNAIKARNSKAVEIMKWLTACALEATSVKREKERLATNNSLRWITPIGFPVEQPYKDECVFRVNTLSGSLSILYADDNTPCLHYKQASASSPNVIHSFDASHKYETCYRMRQKNADFRHRHDCYGTHAADGDLLHETLRRSFIDLCEGNLLENLRTQWTAMYPHATFEEPPQMGNFDLENVANAPYFFH